VAAAFDLVFDDVRTARVFDPSRKLPGDVQAFHKLEPVVAVEVRAKPVTYSDAVHFVRSVAAAGFTHAMIAGLDAVDAKVLHLSKEAWQETGVFVTVHPQFSDCTPAGMQSTHVVVPSPLQPKGFRMQARSSSSMTLVAGA